MKILVILIVLIIIAVQIVAALRERATVQAYPREGQIVDVGGVEMHVIVQGEGPDLVLIHGASGSTRDFTFDFADRLSDRYRVFIVDRPGLGYSTSALPGETSMFATKGASPTLQAQHISKAVKELGAENPIVVGHSYGGIVSLAWGLEDQENIAGLVLLGSVSNPWPGGLGWYYDVNGSFLGGAVVPPLLSAFAPQSAIDATMVSIFEPQDAPENYSNFVGPRLVLRRDSLRSNARQIMNLRPEVVKLSPRYGELTLPVEILHGDADTIVPLNIHSAVLVDQIEASNLVVLPGVGHMPHHTNPDDVIAAIDRIRQKAGL